MRLEKFDPDAFLTEYWQKKPLFIKNPWQDWINPLEPDELAGLACDEDVESRLVVQTDENWEVHQGPFLEDRFTSLGKQNWTLLVQAVDHFVPEVAALIEPFRFIPNWRIDDVMVSYAADCGGVGPHFDQYDVFLIQGLGKRKWQVGSLCNHQSPLLPHDDLRLLADFEPIEEWVCEPGDILYVPPSISHNGVAIGDDCVTYSIGFRAPSRSELQDFWIDKATPETLDDIRYTDPNLKRQKNPGEVTYDAIEKLRSMTSSKGEEFTDWIGHYLTVPKYPDMDWAPDMAVSETEIVDILNHSDALHRNPASRFSFIRNSENSVQLFVDGNSFDCRDAVSRFAEKLCGNHTISVEQSDLQMKEIASLIAHLYNQGSLMIPSKVP